LYQSCDGIVNLSFPLIKKKKKKKKKKKGTKNAGQTTKNKRKVLKTVLDSWASPSRMRCEQLAVKTTFASKLAVKVNASVRVK
jgi:hypothetical protein